MAPGLKKPKPRPDVVPARAEPPARPITSDFQRMKDEQRALQRRLYAEQLRKRRELKAQAQQAQMQRAGQLATPADLATMARQAMAQLPAGKFDPRMPRAPFVLPPMPPMPVLHTFSRGAATMPPTGFAKGALSQWLPVAKAAAPPQASQAALPPHAPAPPPPPPPAKQEEPVPAPAPTQPDMPPEPANPLVRRAVPFRMTHQLQLENLRRCEACNIKFAVHGGLQGC